MEVRSEDCVEHGLSEGGWNEAHRTLRCMVPTDTR